MSAINNLSARKTTLNKILSSHTFTKNETSNLFSDEQERYNALANQDILDKTAMLASLKKLSDLRAGITHTVETHNINGQEEQFVIRDATGEVKELAENSQDVWMRAIINNFRAADELLEVNSKLSQTERITLRESLNNGLKEVLKNYDENSTDKENKRFIKESNTLIANLFVETGLYNDSKKIAKDLTMAKDFANLQDQSANIVTLFADQQGQIISSSSLKITELTAKQKQEYKDIANGVNTPRWYNELGELEQKLVTKYSAHIATGNYVLPTQLRFLNGLKNAYYDQTHIISNAGQEPTLVKHGVRCANPGYFAAKSAETKLEVSQDSAQQIRQVLGDDVKTNFVCYNQKANEAKLVETASMVAQETKARFNNLPVNWAAYTPNSRDVQGFKEMTSEVEQQQNKFSHKIKQALTTAKATLKSFKGNFVNKKDLNTEAICSINQLSNANGEITVSFCKSGKDRTGAMAELTQSHMLTTHMNKNEDYLKYIATQAAKAGHNAYLADGQGGSLGCRGIKSHHSKLTDPKVIDFKNNAQRLFLTTADNNSCKILKPKEKPKHLSFSLEIPSSMQRKNVSRTNSMSDRVKKLISRMISREVDKKPNSIAKLSRKSSKDSGIAR